MPRRKTPYRSKIKIGVDASGNDVYKYFQGYTKAELDQARQAIVAKYITGEALEPDRLFGDYATEWYRVRKEPFVSAATRNNYRSMLNKHILPAFGDRNLRAITALELQAFVNGFGGKSKSQISSALDTLQQIFAAAKADHLVRVDPAENLHRPQAKPPAEKRALTEDERARLRQLFATHPDGLYLAVMYYTGMRPGEVRGLQWGDIDWDANLIHVVRDIDYAAGGAVGGLKTEKSQRYIPVADALRALLYPARQAPAAFVFPGRDGKPLAQVTAARMWIRLMAAAGFAEEIPDDEKTCYGSGDIRGQYRPTITPHAMRHNFITMCWEQGVDIVLTMRMVGHTDYETTRNIYTHLSAVQMESARAQLDSMFSADSPSCRKVASPSPHPADT
jgi:integrase